MANYKCFKCGKVVVRMQKGEVRTGAEGICMVCLEKIKKSEMKENLKNAADQFNEFGRDPLNSFSGGDSISDLLNKLGKNQ